MEAVHLPLKRGSMDDIVGGASSSQLESSESGDRLSQGDTQAIYAREARIQVDYSRLSDDCKEVVVVVLE